MGKTLSIEEATAIAKQCNTEYNECEEYIDAYWFYLNDGIERVGGDTGVIIEKAGGRILKWTQYFMDDSRKCTSTGKIVQI